MRHHCRYHLLFLALIALVPWPVRMDAGTETAELGALHRRILEIVHGEPRSDVAPTPHYCATRGLIPDDPSVDPFEWYVSGKGGCKATYAANLASIRSPLSDGGTIQHFIFDEVKRRQLEDALARLAVALQVTPPMLGDRFDLQMTLWELVASLQFSRDIRIDEYPEISQAAVDRLLAPALGALRATLFTEEQVAALPATLADLAELSGEPSIEPWARRLLAGDEAILEDLFPSQVHGGFAQGRLFSRVFLTSDDAEELERLRGYLNQRVNLRLGGFKWQSTSPLPPESLTLHYPHDLVDLPQQYSGIHGILLEFFNVLDTRFEVVPTSVVASWQELWFSSRVEDREDLRAVDRVTGLRIVNYQKQLGLFDLSSSGDARASFPIYRTQPEDAVSRVLFTDVNPVYPDTEVTTVRGQCFSCHNGKLKTFDRRLRKAGFVRPFSARAEELYDRQVEIKAGQAFEKWSAQYLDQAERHP